MSEQLEQRIKILEKENEILKEELKKRVEEDRMNFLKSIQKFLDQEEKAPFGCGPDEA